MPETSDEPEDDALPANIALAVCCASYRDALDRGLVILAMNLPYWHVQARGGRHELYVETERLSRVTKELQAFDEEQANWHPHQADHGIQERPASFYVPYLGTLVLIATFFLQNAYAPEFTEAGRMDAIGLFDRGEWWRPLTALFLHGDVAHLMGNLIFGLWYGNLVNRGLGTWVGWGFILLSGVLGNTLVAVLHYPSPHLSLGASTSVFGALGLLVAEGLAHRWNQRLFSHVGPILIPFVAGGVLLGWTGGFDDPQTDGTAHAFGFFCGILLGLAAALPQWRRERTT